MIDIMSKNVPSGKNNNNLHNSKSMNSIREENKGPGQDKLDELNSIKKKTNGKKSAITIQQLKDQIISDRKAQELDNDAKESNKKLNDSKLNQGKKKNDDNLDLKVLNKKRKKEEKYVDLKIEKSEQSIKIKIPIIKVNEEKLDSAQKDVDLFDLTNEDNKNLSESKKIEIKEEILKQIEENKKISNII